MLPQKVYYYYKCDSTKLKRKMCKWLLFWCCLFAMLNRTYVSVRNDEANIFSKLKRELQNQRLQYDCMIAL